ncbi:MAG: DUF3883 domain-containing protein [Bacteroidales bacterium]|jgi:HD-GYP domain-containing protein (c-di-GMP phosphodiesterase class II)|nr:DUF3883 domain-containing protein [Bacteroidales bacterium]
MVSSWSYIEVELIVADYFSMLSAELKGNPYSKEEHRRALIPLLSNRSKGSVEFKHQNISAVLANMGLPYIKGYLPRYNYQGILAEKVSEYVAEHMGLERQFDAFAGKIVKRQDNIDFNGLLVDFPEEENLAQEELRTYARNPVKVNYLEKEQRNKSLGELGEELVLDFEKWNLKRLVGSRIANQVRWISKEEGDGAGYDILSKDPSGCDKYIEVKTTKLTRKTPVFFSKNELDFSMSSREKFYLYRLFSFADDPHMFIKRGSLNDISRHVEALSFKGYL